MWALLKILLGLFGLYKQDSAEEVGAIKQNNKNLKAEVADREKEIADMRAEKNFSDFIAAHPDDSERVRRILNARLDDKK